MNEYVKNALREVSLKCQNQKFTSKFSENLKSSGYRHVAGLHAVVSRTGS
jgi:hypothetical protein